MSEDVPMVAPENPVTELVSEMVRRGHESRDVVVVVDEERRPLGIVTERDVISKVFVEELPKGEYLREILSRFETLVSHIRDHDKSRARVASDLMTSPAICIDEGVSVAEAAGLMAARSLRQMPVLREGVVVGLLRRTHIVTAIADLYAAGPQPAEEQ